MPYVLLALGILVSLYGAKLLLKSTQEPEPPVTSSPAPPVDGEREVFEKILTCKMEEGTEDGQLYDLKEQVESRLAELNQQKELVTHLMLRVEKKLEREEGPMQGKEDPGEDIFNLDNLERARLHNDIYLLYDQGVPLVEIARQLGRGKGEIQLVLGLRN